MANKLQNLIQKLCPDGVKFVKLGEVCERKKGTPITATQMKHIACEEGEIRIFAGGKTVVNARLEDIPKANITTIPAVLVQSRGVIDVVYYDKPFTFKNEMWAYTHPNLTTLKFIYYFLKQNVQALRDKALSMGAFPQISIADTENLEIPLPPLAIQSRIVEILDNFSSLTAELQAELQARRSQYEYYRNHLLSFDGYDNIQNENNTTTNNSAAAQGKTVKWVKLGEVCNDKLERISSQLLNSENYTSVENLIKDRGGRIDAENVPSEGNFIKYNKEDILIGNIRPYLKKIWFADKVGGTNGDVIVIQVCDNYSDTIDKRYLFQVLSSDKFFDYDNNFAKGGKMPRGDKSAIKNFPIPLPSLSEQRRIADILDRFEALTTDLQCGLPAEIEARQQQYEYYRNKLLTFND